MYKFDRFLVLKIAERVQFISREKCSGCVTGLILDQLHQCMQITLKEKVARFLPRAKNEALTRLDKLFSLYHQTAWVDDDHISRIEMALMLTAQSCLQSMPELACPYTPWSYTQAPYTHNTHNILCVFM